MALTDPLAISAASPTPALNFAVVDSSKPYTVHRSAPEGEYTMMIQHTPGKNGSQRHYVKITQTKDVVLDDRTTKQSSTVSMSLSASPLGFDAADLTAMYELLDDVVRAATLAKIINNEG